MPHARPAPADDLVELVQDALAHLHDPGHLQTHPLADAGGGRHGATSAGWRLQQALLDAVERLRPAPGAPPGPRAARGHELLRLRYVEALEVTAACARLAIGHSEYYREHRRALAAVTALLRERPATGDGERSDAAPKPRGHLPTPLTSFVGREEDVATVLAQLRRPEVRLLTLTGAGGVGKTRLALRVAADLRDEYADGVWFVDLASLAEPALVPRAVATALGVRERPARPIEDTLLDHARTRRLLLLLDNCEHLVDACSALVNALLAACPDVRVLATSRGRLRTGGEVVWRVPSLALPDPRQPGAVARAAAARLFDERARAVEPSFALTERNAAAVAQVCRRLDGIPLAIELAAARARVLDVEQIAARFDDRFRLLAGGDLTAPARQRTLRATVDWSYELLSDAERSALARLSVFAGGWTIEAAEAVCAASSLLPTPDAEGMLDRLTGLVDQSLVVVDRSSGTARAGAAAPNAVRYRLLETIQQYAAERLDESGQAEATRAGHLRWCLALAERAGSALFGPDQAEWHEQLEVEHSNLRAAVDWSVERGDPEPGLRIGAALWRFFVVRGHVGEWRGRLAALLSRAEGPSVTRVRALFAAAQLGYLQGDYGAARGLAGQALAEAERLGDERGRGDALVLIGAIVLNQGEYAAAERLAGEGLALGRKLGNRVLTIRGLHMLGVVARLQGDCGRALARHGESLRLLREQDDRWFLAHALSNIGLAHYQESDYGAAGARFEESLAIRRELRDGEGTAWSLLNLGDVARAGGQPGAASTQYERGLALLRELGDRSGTADALAALGRLAREHGDRPAAHARLTEALALRWELGQTTALPGALEDLGELACADAPARALRLGAAAAALRERLTVPATAPERGELDRWIAAARRAVGAVAAEESWAAGGELTAQLAVEEALAAAPPRAGRAGERSAGIAFELTPREQEVARLIARGRTNREIATELVIARPTAERHVTNLMAKLGLARRAQVATWAAEHLRGRDHGVP